MTSDYVTKQLTIFAINGVLQSTDGSFHFMSDIVYYEKNKPFLTQKQRFMRDKYLNKGAFFTNDFINWYSSAIVLINILKHKSSK